MTDRRKVIFVGGTRFSGADAVAALLAERPAGSALPAAIRFHTESWGIPALLHGRIGLADFAARLQGGEIAERVRRERLDAAISGLRDAYHADPLESCRELFWSLVEELGGAEAGVLVDASPGNLVEAHTLIRLFPEATFVHVVRDGRDVAAAAATESGSRVSRVAVALDRWAAELREIERGLRGEEDGAPYAIPDERLAVAMIDELAASEGGAAYRSLLARLGLEEDGPVAASTSSKLDPAPLDHGHGRQARGMARRRVTRRYERTLQALEAEGNHAAPTLRRAYERQG